MVADGFATGFDVSVADGFATGFDVSVADDSGVLPRTVVANVVQSGLVGGLR